MQRQPVQAYTRFPFDADYQRELLRMVCEDQIFSNAVSKWLKPEFFGEGTLAWAYSLIERHREQYNVTPSTGVLVNEAAKLDPQVRQLYAASMDRVSQMPFRDEQWLKDSVVDFVQRNIFAEAYKQSKDLYNSGRVGEAYDVMQREMEEVRSVTWKLVDRGWLGKEFAQRNAERANYDPGMEAIPTGFPWLDNDILDGGLSLGELGIFVAYAKIGKSMVLVNFTARAVRGAFKRVLVCVLEGKRQQWEARLDACFSGQLYQEVKEGLTGQAYQELMAQYRYFENNVVVRGFTDEWDYTIEHIWQELRELRTHFGWVPDLIVIDYGDLLNGRGKFNSTYEEQKATFRDQKSLANRGYAVWTASQATRPKENADRPHLIRARNIADCYEKVRVADFIGTINATPEEQDAGLIRIFAELYRDNSANKLYEHRCDLTRSTIYGQENRKLTPESFVGGASGEQYQFGFTQQQAPI